MTRYLAIGAVALGLFGAGCDDEVEADQAPPGGTVEPGNVAPGPGATRDDPRVVTPGENGVVEPMDDRVIMPPEIMGKPEGTDINVPDPNDQLERNRVEHGQPL